MRLGVIGYGTRLRHMVGEFKKADPACELAAITEINLQRLKEEPGMDNDEIELFEDAGEMLRTMNLDGVAIGTRCSLHTKFALKVLETGLPLFLEKPVATTYEDLGLLSQANEATSSEVVVSFPLRGSKLVSLAKEIVDSGKIGTVEHVQAVNNVPYGGIYYQGWYRDENETRGLFLQKATHDFDYITYLLGKKPVTVCAMKSKQIFKGSKPAGLRCTECDEQDACLESAVLKRLNNDFVPGENCCFAVDTGNEDSGSALIKYDSGMHISYSQNFFARRGAQARGARLFGYKGTLEFDFYTGILKIYMHHTPRVETYELEQTGVHHGGDATIARNFVDIMRKRNISKFSLETGILSALICLKARESALTNTFQDIHF